MIKWILPLFLFPVITLAQPFADPEHYLLDSVVLEELQPSERVLLDSVLALYHASDDDTLRVQWIGVLTEEIQHLIWKRYNLILLKMTRDYESHETDAKRSFMGIMHGAALSNRGLNRKREGALDLAIADYEAALAVNRMFNYERGISNTLNNLAAVYVGKGLIQRGLDMYMECIRINERIGNKEGVGYSYLWMGYIQKGQNEIDVSLGYILKAYKVFSEIGHQRGLAMAVSNLGVLHKDKKEYEKALMYYSEALTINSTIGNQRGVAMALNNTANIYRLTNQNNLAREYILKAIALRRKSNEINGLTSSLSEAGMLYLQMNLLDSASSFGEEALELANKLGSPRRIQGASGTLAKIYKETGDYKNAMEMTELAVKSNDSILNEANQKAAIRQQTKYEFETTQLVAEQEEKEVLRLEAEENSRRDNLQYSVILIAILSLFGGVLALGYINVSERMAEGIIFFSFLILFEFLLVLADPYIDDWSGGAPGIKLLFNAGIAALIFPAHAFFEGKLKGRFVKQ